MRVKEIKSAKAEGNGVKIVADIEWRTGKVGDSDDLLVSETRTLTVSKVDGVTQVDFHTELTAARDLTLGGDLQHAGGQAAGGARRFLPRGVRAGRGA